MGNHLSKFSPNLTEKTTPLHELLNKKNEWVRGEPQIQAFEDVKQALVMSPVLSLFNHNCDTIVSADASSHGLGPMLLQKQPGGEWKPVSYISRSLTPTEQRYAQIEKETLAFTWACEPFSVGTFLCCIHLHQPSSRRTLMLHIPGTWGPSLPFGNLLLP